MDYRQMEYFLEICKHRNMTTAANQIHISEQALSKSMQRLEEELGVPLFIRKNKGVELTPYGKELQEEAQAYLSHHEYILDHFQSIHTQRRPKLVLGIATGLLAQWLPESFLSDFIAEHPETDFEIHCYFEDDFNRIQQAYDRDLIFCTSHTFPDNWQIAFCTQRPLRVLMSKTHPLASKDTLILTDLIHQKIAMSIDETPNQRAIISWLKRADIEPSMYFGPSEIPLLNALITNNDFLSFYGGDEHLLPSHLTVRSIEDMDVTWDFYILKHSKTRLPMIARELIRQVKQAVSFA